MSPTTGVIAGTPTLGGKFNFIVTAADANNVQNSSSGNASWTFYPPSPTASAYTASAKPTNQTQLIDPRSSASSPAGLALTLSVTQQPQHGVAAMSGGLISYTPNTNYVGTDSFQYTVTDPYGNYAAATVNVTDLDIPPIAGSFPSQSVATGVLGTYDPRSVASSPVGSSLAIIGVSKAAHGLANFTSSTVTYLALGYVGTDSFSYTIQDANGGQTTGTFNITVTDTAPTASPMTLSTTQGVAVSRNVTSLVSGPLGMPYTISVGSTTRGGTATTDGATIYYTPPANFVGQDSFVYTATDPFATSATGQVYVNVDNTPNQGNTTATTSANTPVTITLGNSYVPGPQITSVSQGQQGGRVTIITGTSSILYTPPAKFVGIDTFTFLGLGYFGSNVSGTISVQVTGNSGGGGGDGGNGGGDKCPTC